MTDPLFVSDDDKVEAALKALRVAAGGIVRGYIYKDEYDRPMIRDFVERYPRLNIADEVRKWAAWMTEFEHRKGKKVRHRARLTTWVQRAATGDYGRSSGPRGGSAAQAATAHGDTSEALERW